MHERTLRRLQLWKRLLEVWIALVVVFFAAMWLHHSVAHAASRQEFRDQHRYVDVVLVPRFQAAWAEWALGHYGPQDSAPNGALRDSHYLRIDAGDVKRGAAMHASLKELEHSLGALGY